MEKSFYILVGRSGSGKGTQAGLLKTYLENKGFDKVLHVTTGGGFRNFITQDNYVAKLARDVNNTGGLQPEFLAVWGWSNIFIDTVEGGESIILDGAPRKPFEVSILHSAITFLGYKDPVVIYLDTSENVSREHIAHRGREDDLIEDDVNRRMNWFETDVLPTLDVYLHDPRYIVLHINGNQTINEVHQEIIQKLDSLTKND